VTTIPLTQTDFDNIGRGYDPIAARSSSIHSDCYRDDRYLAVEREHIFHRSWQFVCHEEKLRQPGSYVTASLQGQSIFVARDAEGVLRAFYNVCQHRGHELLQGEGITDTITCPYHAWVYDLNGSLRRARRSELIENFQDNDIRLKTIQIEIFCHLVFVNLDPDASTLAEQSGNLAQEIMAYAPDLSELTFAHRLSYRLEANWKTVVDNFLECYHCPVAHKDFTTLVEMDTYQVKTHGIYSSHMAKAGRTENQAYGVDEVTVTDHAVWYLWPNMTLMRYPGRGNFMVWRIIPVNAEETYEEFDFFFENDTPSDAEKEAIQFIDDVLQPEDIALVESVQRGMQTPAFNQGRYLVDPQESGMSEHGVHHFHGLVLDAYRRACSP